MDKIISIKGIPTPIPSEEDITAIADNASIPSNIRKQLKYRCMMALKNAPSVIEEGLSYSETLTQYKQQKAYEMLQSQLNKYVNIGDDGTWTLNDEGIKEIKKFHNQYGTELPSDKTSAHNFIIMELYSTTLKTDRIMECGIGIIAFLRHAFLNLKTNKLITHPEKLHGFTTQWIKEHEDTINSMKKEGYGSDHIMRNLSAHFARLLKEITEKEEQEDQQ